ILEPLYETCLDRMEAFLAEWGENGKKAHPNYHKKFTEVLARVDAHPNRRYFVLKSIILNNLYAVDIMEEAVEICKLRLFLKLAAQVEPDSTKDNLGIEPLPDIDFNIRAGNTLVGYATADEVRRCMKEDSGGQMKLMDEADLSAFDRFNTRCADVEQAFTKFRQLQTEGDGSVPFADKLELQKRLKALEDELNHHLAVEYGVKVSNKAAYAKWLKSHQPFHWFIEFYGIINAGGFDVVIGNPPYVEWSKIKAYRPQSINYSTLSCGNIYTAICERSYGLIPRHGRFGMIVPISCVATDRMRPLRDVWTANHMRTHASYYSGDAHPSVLFIGVKFRLAILLQEKSSLAQVEFSTHFQRWYAEARGSLFPLINYTKSNSDLVRVGLHPKICSPVHYHLLSKLCLGKKSVSAFVRESSRYEVYSHRIVAHFVKALDFVPHFSSERDGVKRSEDYKIFGTSSKAERDVLSAVLNSTLFYQWFVTYSDVYHCGRELILDFPLDIPALVHSCGVSLQAINTKLMNNLRKNSVRRKIPYERTGLVEYDEFYPKLSKPIIDEIDTVLAKHYGFTEEELDFIINYDIKYRLGRGPGEEEE
ncbi:MAG: Eco57I restriction-modification methylase domain-containing protein, partial [Nitrospiraceae bacterium]|nr:Eco57I restriction-modification methylase domain-containing protein [Nitrospiraceae bacterium]